MFWKIVSHSPFLCLSHCPPPQQWVPQWVISPLPLESPWLLNRVVVCFGRGSISNSLGLKKFSFVQPLVSKGHILWPRTSCNFSCLKHSSYRMPDPPPLHPCFHIFVCAFEIWPRWERSLCLCVYRPQLEIWYCSHGHQNNPRFLQSCYVLLSSSPQQRYKLTLMLPGSIILVLHNNMKVHIIKMDFKSEISGHFLSHSAGELLCGPGFR